MRESGATIPPWPESSLWMQAELSLQMTLGNGDDFSGAYGCAAEYARLMTGMDRLQGALSSLSCVDCSKICCHHATVWYDFRDLLFAMLHRGALPERQIYRGDNGWCAMLGPKGCTLPRVQRPFLCTWYVCAEQKRILALEDYRILAPLNDGLLEMKMLRQRMEMQFLETISRE